VGNVPTDELASYKPKIECSGGLRKNKAVKIASVQQIERSTRSLKEDKQAISLCNQVDISQQSSILRRHKYS